MTPTIDTGGVVIVSTINAPRVLDLDRPQLARFDQEDADGLGAAVGVLLQGSELRRYAD
jgi:putative methionine-R-sulfoxide reductase with GAF domain